jgi:hypothetical protein
MRRVDGQVQRHGAEHLDNAQQDPARPRDQDAQVPAHAVRGGLGRHEAQEVDLLADLRDQRDADGGGGAEHQYIEPAVVAGASRVVHQLRQQFRLLVQDGDEGQRHQDQPHGLGQHLDAADQGHAMRDQRDDRQRADHVAEIERQAEIQFECVGHNGRLEREQDERERGVDEGGDGRADVAEAGAAREQVHVDAVFGGVVADRQAGEKDDQADGHDGPQRVDEAVVDGDGAADRFEHQKGDGAEGGVGDAEHRPFTERARRVAQRVIFDRLVGHPGVVVAPDLDDALWRFGFCRGDAHVLPVWLIVIFS